MTPALLHRLLNIAIAAIWLINGLYCKLLHFVPRHEAIVGSIVGQEHAAIFTKLIGVAEIIMAAWILSRYQSRLNAMLQMLVIATMNVLELLLVPDLLLWGRLNAVFAFLFILLIYYNEFHVSRKTSAHA